MSQRQPRVLTDEELAAIYQQVNETSATGKRNRALLQVMADAALRVGEVVKLRVSDLTTETGRITRISVRRGKGAEDRAVFVTPQLSDKLLRWLDARKALGLSQAGALFCTIKHGVGRPLPARYIQRLVSDLAEKAGIQDEWHTYQTGAGQRRAIGKVTPHTLRHTAATRMLRSSRNLRVVQDQLGHASVRNTQIYTHLADPERQAAAEELPPVDGEEVRKTDQVQVALEEIAALETKLAELKDMLADALGN